MTTPQVKTYLDNDAYAALTAKLIGMIDPAQFHGTDAQTEVVAALGGIGNIWPAAVLSDPERD